MRRLARWAGAIVLVLVVCALALLAALPYLVDLPRVRALLAGSASHALGRPVRFASVSLKLLPLPSLELRGLEVDEDPRFGPEPFVTLDRGSLRLRLRPLLMGRVEFGGLTLERPLIRLVEGGDGRWNISTLGVVQDAGGALRSVGPPRQLKGPGTATTASLLAAGVVIEEAVVMYRPRDTGVGEYRLTGLDLRLRGAGTTLAFDGKGVVRPGDIVVEVTGGSLALTGSRPLAEAPLRGTITVEATELRPMAATLVPSGFGASGKGKGTFNLGGVLGSPKATGSMVFPLVALSRKDRQCLPPERTLRIDDVSVATSLTERQLLGRPLLAKVAGGTMKMNLTATLDGDLQVTLADVEVHGLPLKNVLVDFLCDGYAVTGPLDLGGAFAFRASDITRSMSGGGRFTVGHGEVVGRQAIKLFGDVLKLGETVAFVLGEDMASPLEFQSITGTYRITNGVATSRDLLYTGRGFTVTAAGAYTLAGGGVNVDMVVRHKRGQVNAKVTGTAAAPLLRVDVAGALRDVESRALESGLRDLLKRFR